MRTIATDARTCFPRNSTIQPEITCFPAKKCAHDRSKGIFMGLIRKFSWSGIHPKKQIPSLKQQLCPELIVSGFEIKEAKSKYGVSGEVLING
jgi:hypothetical protein